LPKNLLFPQQTLSSKSDAESIIELRKEELDILRGNGMGERKQWDKIYDYDSYNDLGDPEKGPKHLRPVLSGLRLFPYPRKGRIGRK